MVQIESHSRLTSTRRDDAAGRVTLRYGAGGRAGNGRDAVDGGFKSFAVGVSLFQDTLRRPHI
jgi:hypothetical protein